MIVIQTYNTVFTVQPWCSTVDVYYGWQWGWCGPDCVMHEDTMSWRKDEMMMAKVALQYSNSALWVGLDLYGSLLLGIFILGLILTTVPILGK